MNFGRIIEADCVNVAPPLDERCNDPAFAIENPSICGVQTGLILKPGVALACVLGTIQFKAFSVRNGVEEDVTDEAVFSSGDLSVAVIGATSGNATGLATGEAIITATWEGKSATAKFTVLGGDNCCDQLTVAMLLVMDTTRSMSQTFGGAYAKKFDFAKAAADRLAGEVNEDKDTIGLMHFHGTTVTVDDVPDADAAAVQADIAALAQSNDKTEFYDSLSEAIDTLASVSADRKIIILISDGDDTLTSSFNHSNDPVLLLSDFKDQGGIVMCLGVRAAGSGFALLSAMATGGFFINAYEDNVEEALDYIAGLKGYICAGNCTPAGDEIVSKGQVNYAGFINWDIVPDSGTLDLCGNGFFDFLPGNGLFVDMQGTTPPQTGILQSKATFALEAGHSYRISFKLAGNQRMDQGVQSLRVRVMPTSGASDVLDTAIAVSDYTEGFQGRAVNFNAVGTMDVRLRFNQIEAASAGQAARIGLLLDEIRFEDVTDGTLLLYDNFDEENPTYVTPGCGEGDTWIWIAAQHAYGYAYGYDCEGDGCLDEPPSAQIPDPDPLPDIESGTAPPTTTTYTATRTACASCPDNTQDAGTRISPVVDAAYANITASSEADNGVSVTESWLAFDDAHDTYWASDGSVPQWLQVELEAEGTAATYGLRTLFVGKPTEWTLSGSNDGTTWTVLDTRSNPDGTLLIENIENVFPIAEPASYLYYRLTVTAVNSKITYPGDPVGGVERVGIVELALYEASDEEICMTATATSNTSQQQASTDAYNEALALAEAQLNCRAIYTSTQSYTAHCATGYGLDVTRSASAVSFVSQADADLQAYEAAKDEAEAALDCTLSNHEQAILINDFAPADIYPSVKYVEGETGVITNVQVRINGFSHGFAPDVQMVLVSPSGTKVELMRNCGDNRPEPVAVNNLNLVFDDAGPAIPETAAGLTSGTYAPSSYGVMASLPAPAPGAPYSGMLSSFNGEDPNGPWLLYVADDYALDSGSIANGWDLVLTLA